MRESDNRAISEQERVRTYFIVELPHKSERLEQTMAIFEGRDEVRFERVQRGVCPLMRGETLRGFTMTNGIA